MPGMSRRRFLGYGIGAGAALAVPWTVGVQRVSAAMGSKLTKYVQPLPVPGGWHRGRDAKRPEPVHVQAS
jgi:hypothetical protein